ncbi:MAG TPA: efflux RND transporter periplasmic adaptor subunit [Treponemataceae bacterium]|nr:efflux RND transporter periplasmic adaptor subunit [Treponemataceae bacterium]
MPPKKNSILIRYAAFAVTAAGLIVLIMLLTRKDKASYEAPPPAVVIAQPETKTITQSLTLSGYIEAGAMIPIVPMVSGRIIEYPVKAGDSVDKGSLIAVLDDAAYMQTMLQAKAAYFGHQSTFERIESLYKANATTQQNYDSVKAQRDAAKAQFDLANLQLSYTRVTSPITGTVITASMSEGAIAGTQGALAIVADLSNLVVRLNVPEKYYALFNELRGSIYADVIRPATQGYSEQAVSRAYIDTIDPYIQSESKVFKAVFTLNENLHDFVPGMYVKVSVHYKTWENVQVLPHSVRKIDGSCFTYDEETQTAVYNSFTPKAQDDNVFIVPDELSNAWFIIDGQGVVFDKQKVTIREPVAIVDYDVK